MEKSEAKHQTRDKHALTHSHAHKDDTRRPASKNLQDPSCSSSF